MDELALTLHSHLDCSACVCWRMAMAYPARPASSSAPPRRCRYGLAPVTTLTLHLHLTGLLPRHGMGWVGCEQERLGMVNNRFFEALACGALVLTPTFPELEVGRSSLYPHRLHHCIA